jgi:hypothetical protein
MDKDISEWEKRFDERFHLSCWNDGEYEKETVKAFIHSLLLADREKAIENLIEIPECSCGETDRIVEKLRKKL